jgi:glycosyltransferase involved in cell wall biosynthesis
VSRRRLTVVLPCLDEEKTVGACVLEARRGLEALGAEPEVLVVDNGSSDATARVAAEAGARVVPERRRGYGNALWRGIREARGEVVILGDADGSYRFDELEPLVAAVEAGADLVMGSRRRGSIEPGAMPWLHRRVGTPVLTTLVNLLFGTRISDVNCGQRALRAAAAKRLQLRAGGMEFASEMVIKAALAGLTVAEVPVDFRRDRRGRPPHLRTWRDGWRHLRFILLFAPNLVLLAPGAAFLAVGAFLAAPSFLGRPGFGGAAAFSGAALVVLGAQLIQVGLIVKTWYHVEGFYRRPYLERLFRYLGFEVGLVLGLGLLAVGAIVGFPLLLAWRRGVGVEPGRVAAALTFLVLGAQVVGSSVILSVLGIRRR